MWRPNVFFEHARLSTRIHYTEFHETVVGHSTKMGFSFRKTFSVTSIYIDATGGSERPTAVSEVHSARFQNAVVKTYGLNLNPTLKNMQIRL